MREFEADRETSIRAQTQKADEMEDQLASARRASRTLASRGWSTTAGRKTAVV
jgi:hypothetical protein